MASSFTKKVYSLWNCEQKDLDSAPSLDLPALKTIAFFMPQDGGKYMLFAAEVVKSAYPQKCRYCGRSGGLIASGKSDWKLIHDVVRNNHRVDIVYQPPRVECQSCSQRYTIDVEGISGDHRMTERLLDYLRKESFLRPFTDLAELSGVSTETICNIFDEEAIKYDEERKHNPLKAPRVLGIDEKHINNYMRGTFVDVENGTLLDMTEDNKAENMQDAIKQFAGWDNNIEVVTTDMSNAYLRWLPELLPKATIVIDKFHVIQDVERKVSKTVKELYRYRKELILKEEDPTERARQLDILNYLNDSRRLMNYSMESIVRDENTDKAKQLATLMDEFPEFRLLRKIYYQAEIIYQQTTREDAEAEWDKWAELLPPNGDKKYQEWCDLYSILPPMFDSFRTFNRSGFLFFKPFILNYFNPGCRHTNAATEGLNNLVGSIDSVGNGYSFRVLRAKCLYASLIHDRISYTFDIKSIKKWKPTTGFVTIGYSAHDTYTWVKAYVFSQQSVEPIKPICLFDQNDEFLATFKKPFVDHSANIDEELLLFQASGYLKAD